MRPHQAARLREEVETLERAMEILGRIGDETGLTLRAAAALSIPGFTRAAERLAQQEEPAG